MEEFNLSQIVNIVAADDLVMHGDKASTVVILITFSQNILASVPEGLSRKYTNMTMSWYGNAFHITGTAMEM